jgi:hypothetical protein
MVEGTGNRSTGGEEGNNKETRGGMFHVKI